MLDSRSGDQHQSSLPEGAKIGLQLAATRTCLVATRHHKKSRDSNHSSNKRTRNHVRLNKNYVSQIAVHMRSVCMN